MTKCRLLFNEEPITINRLAAKVLGLNEAIVVQQIHYWLNINEKAKQNLIDGRYWTYNTLDAWQKENFDFWSTKTIGRVFDKLEKRGILIKSNHNKYKYDRTLWVTLDYDKLEEILSEYEIKTNVEIPTKGQVVHMSNPNKRTSCPYGKGQVVHMDKDKLSSPIPETTQRLPEISLATQSEDKPLVVETNKELIEKNTHLLLDSTNKQKKVSQWSKDRLLKAIEVFKEREGQYFTLLEKIYKDDKNFILENKGSNEVKHIKTRFHNVNETFKKYDPQELEVICKDSQKDKFGTDALMSLYNSVIENNNFNELSPISKTNLLNYAREKSLSIPEAWAI